MAMQRWMAHLKLHLLLVHQSLLHGDYLAQVPRDS
jgi:hypothetical protein